MKKKKRKKERQKEERKEKKKVKKRNEEEKARTHEATREVLWPHKAKIDIAAPHHRLK